MRLRELGSEIIRETDKELFAMELFEHRRGQPGVKRGRRDPFLR